MRKSLTVALIIVTLTVGFLIYRSRTAALPVETVIVTRKAIAQTVSVNGQLDSEVKAELNFETTGKVAAINVRVGNRAEKGQLLTALDPTNLEDELREAQINLTKAQADLDKVGEARREFQEAHRYDSPSQELFAQFGQYDAQVRAAEALIDSYRLQITQAQRNLNHIYLTAPIAGTVTAINLHEGELVRATTTRAIVLADLAPENLYFKAEIAESDLGKIAAGQTAEISLDAAGTETFAGSVREIAPTTSLNSAGDSVVITKIFFDQEIPEGLHVLDLSGDAEIILQQKGAALTLPLEVIGGGDGEKFVWKVEGDRLRKTTVETGLENEFEAEIIADLAEGDRVVAKNLDRLKEGQRVKIQL